MNVNGLERVIARMDRLRRQAQSDGNQAVVVGFTQTYAIYVHEDLSAYHKTGNAKFLEGPARRMASQLGRIINSAYQKTGSMRQSLLIAGLRLQRESQMETPVDTSALRSSAFTTTEDQLENTASQAFERSEAIRLAELARRANLGRKRGGS